MSIFNFFSSSIQNRIFIEGKEDFLTGFYPYLPIDQKKADAVLKQMQLWGKEKELVYCSLFIAGKTDSGNKHRRYMFSPLLIYPAEIIQHNELYYLQPDKSQMRINHSALSSIFEDSPDADKSDLYEALHNSLFGQDIDVGKIHEISQILNTHLAHLDSSSAVQYPELLSRKEAEEKFEALKKGNHQSMNFDLLSVSAACTVNKSTDIRGILNELKEIAESNAHSLALKALFGKEKQTKLASALPKTQQIPVVLSSAQKNALHTGTQYPLSVIIGPPGTGKTYTIAALAAEQMLAGKSVLIASRTDQAVDVIEKKIADILQSKNISLRAGRKQYLRELKTFLDDILNGFVQTDNEHSAAFFQKQIRRSDKALKKAEKKFSKPSLWEIKIGELLSKSKLSLFDRLQLTFLKYRKNRYPQLFESLIESEQLTDKKNAEIRQYIRHRYSELTQYALKNNRQDLLKLSKVLKTNAGTIQEQIFDDINFNAVFKLFPVWLVKMSDLYKVLPLRKELFDIAIIDEATQCDTASTLPVLQRAKQVVFTGDPKQLRHASFISGIQQKLLSEKYSLSHAPADFLNYRDNSVLDICLQSIENQEQISNLDEHFRSTPAIIRFSNRQFYGNRLRIMTANPLLKPDEGLIKIKTEGKRSQSGYNKAEAEVILKKLKEIIAEKDHLGNKSVQSIGILSPLGDQADYISRRIQQELPANVLSDYQISVGTAYSFQGEERDVMFLSFALDNDSHFMAFRHVEKPDVFNVSISRARSRQYIVHSLNTDKLPADSVLRQYLCDTEDQKQNTKSDVKDDFLQTVSQKLQEKGFSVFPAFPTAGFITDLVIAKNGKLSVIDLIGFPGQFADSFGTERYRILYRAGLKCFPLSYSQWIEEEDVCIRQISDFSETG